MNDNKEGRNVMRRRFFGHRSGGNVVLFGLPSPVTVVSRLLRGKRLFW